MDGPCRDFLLVNVIFAAINTVLMGVLIWQLRVVRSRFARFDFLAGRIVSRFQSVAQQFGRAVEWVITRR